MNNAKQKRREQQNRGLAAEGFGEVKTHRGCCLCHVQMFFVCCSFPGNSEKVSRTKAKLKLPRPAQNKLLASCCSGYTQVQVAQFLALKNPSGLSIQKF